MRKAFRYASVVLIPGVVLMLGSAAMAQEPPPPSLARAGASTDPNGVYLPPPCVPGTPFTDIQCTGLFDAWIEQFVADGITAGCGGGNYCPDDPVTRGQMSVFIERAMRGTANWPPHTQLVWAVKYSDGSPNATASGDALRTAVAAIPTTGNDVPGSTNHWLVKIGPGLYNLGSSALNVPGYVDLEGSGVETTTLTGSAQTTGTIWAHGRNAIRNMSIENSGSGVNQYGVVNSNGRLILRSVEIQASGGTSFAIGIYLDNAMLDMADSSANAGTATGQSRGIHAAGTQYHSMVITRSLVIGQDYTITNSAGYAVDLAYNGLYDGALYNAGAGAYTCIGNYNRSYTLVACP